MEKNKIKISKKGDDGYKVISIRIKEKTLEFIEDISAQSNRSRNEVINILLENAVKETEIEDEP
ncbi:MAG: CopG family transcriptional regulator [Oscillospiraceae bacterium]|jgi:metal-responsive CopG/Arc/MetJ family transcriptional regulator|nr:CopG family transcriptional regulator [Oscillospiraceae bacterium]